MRHSLTLIIALALSPISVLASKRSGHVERARHLRARTNYPKVPYILQDHFQGESFFDKWVFFAQEDPTHGLVNYQTKADARSKKLAYVQDDGTTILTVDGTSTVPVGGKRDSVRISTNQTWNTGLFIADFTMMPYGCSVWPAYWSVGPNWPNSGEIDIIEGVHNQEFNQYTLHTGIECSIPSNISDIGVVGTTLMHSSCQSLPSDNRGCGFLATDKRTFGAGFNAAGGGVFVHDWNPDGIKMWFFPREAIPLDIISQTPDPSSWGQPAATWSADHCDMTAAFRQHSLIIDTTLCGDWAGPAYAGSGCAGTCKQAVADPANFKNAMWGINYISVYQSAPASEISYISDSI